MEDYELEALLNRLAQYQLDEWYDYESEGCVTFSPDAIAKKDVMDNILDFLYDNRSWYLQVINGAYVLLCERP